MVFPRRRRAWTRRTCHVDHEMTRHKVADAYDRTPSPMRNQSVNFFFFALLRLHCRAVLTYTPHNKREENIHERGLGLS